MKVLVLGSGAREHALVRSLTADRLVEAVVAAPGNPGMDLIARCEAIEDITDPAEARALAQRLGVDLVVIGPEAPLVAGVADAIREAGIACFGPSAQAARLEGSKAFAKEVMASAGIPTARAQICTTMAEVDDALDAVSPPYVVKDDGLAAGKGVVVTDDRDAALAHAESRLSRPGGQVVVEEFLDGPEVSLFCITDGTTVLPFAPAQDFKRAGDGDSGPNTGGMGSYCPLDWLPPGFVDDIVERIAQPTVDEMRHRGTPFTGVLYIGLALTSRGPRVVEFNARFGDPDSQVCLARLRNGLGALLYAAATGHLEEFGRLRWSPEAAVSVVLAAEHYPATPRTGDPITGLDAAAKLPDSYVLHAGTRRDADGRVVSAGGRVLNVLGTGADLAAARAAAYRGLAVLDLHGAHYRTDIALKAELGQVGVGPRG